MRPQVVFSEARWIGKKEENPEECELPMPDCLLERRIHKDISLEDAMTASAAEGKTAPGNNGDEAREGDEDDLDEEDDEEEETKAEVFIFQPLNPCLPLLAPPTTSLYSCPHPIILSASLFHHHFSSLL
jgi:hypothetical protein